MQRVSRCEVSVGDRKVGAIGPGMLILLAVRKGDQNEDAVGLADRCAALRIFADGEGKMNLSVQNTGGSAMVVSQFTLYGDTSRGNRPSWGEAAPPETAETLYEVFVQSLQKHLGPARVATGEFRSMMDVALVNDGPVTVILESKARTVSSGGP